MRTLTLFLVLLVAGCGSSDEPTAGEQIADEYNSAMDKAADIETQLEASKQRVDEALDDADDGDSP